MSKRSRDDPADLGLVQPPSKKQRRGEAKPKSEKKKKRREVYDRSSIYQNDEASIRNGVLHLEDSADVAAMRVPDTFLTVVPRDQQTGPRLTFSQGSRRHVQNALTSAAMIKESPLSDLLGAVHLPSVSDDHGAAVAGHGSSSHGVPIQEALITLVNEFRQKTSTMHDLRIGCGLPTSLEHASESVRLASGLINGGDARDEQGDSFRSIGGANSTTQHERDNRSPPLVGLPALTLAKTRATLRPQGQLITTHGYAHESARKVTPRIMDAFKADDAKSFAEFFRDDPDPAVPVGRPATGRLAPENWAVFQQLQREHRDRFERRSEYLEKAAGSMVRPKQHEVSWDYILSKRFPARGVAFGEPPCALGDNCSCMNLARAHNTELDAPPPGFYLPEEMEEFERTGTLPEGPRLCIDDELIRIHRAAMRPNANLQEPMLPINRFYVPVDDKHSFDTAFAIPTTVGNGARRTGVIGFVPKYSAAFRQFRMLHRPGDRPGAQKIRVLTDITPIF